MQKIITTLIQATFQALEALMPPLSNRLALWMFFRPFRRPRPGRELPVVESAQRSRRTLQGFYPRPVSQTYYEAYEWGEGPPVLLVHGWGGRGSQFHALIENLVSAGYKVVTFDAPAHGDTPGKRTNLLEFGEILRDLSEVYGEFEGIVAHSFGAVASIRGLVLDQIPARKFVTIGAPANMDFILQGFSQQVRVTHRSLRSIKAFLNSLATKDLEDFSFLTHCPELTQPLLILHDTDDKSVDHEQGQRIAAAMPKAPFIVSKGLGHNRILSDSATIERILGFLRSEGT